MVFDLPYFNIIYHLLWGGALQLQLSSEMIFDSLPYFIIIYHLLLLSLSLSWLNSSLTFALSLPIMFIVQESIPSEMMPAMRPLLDLARGSLWHWKTFPIILPTPITVQVVISNNHNATTMLQFLSNLLTLSNLACLGLNLHLNDFDDPQEDNQHQGPLCWAQLSWAWGGFEDKRRGNHENENEPGGGDWQQRGAKKAEPCSAGEYQADWAVPGGRKIGFAFDFFGLASFLGLLLLGRCDNQSWLFSTLRIVTMCENGHVGQMRVSTILWTLSAEKHIELNLRHN